MAVQNEFGKRVESSWHMSEQDAAHGRRKDRRHGRDSDADRINQRLSEIAAEVRAGNVYSVPWEFFRFVALRQAPHKQAAVMLAAWCASSGLTPRLEARTVAIGDSEHRVIYLLLTSEQ